MGFLSRLIKDKIRYSRAINWQSGLLLQVVDQINRSLVVKEMAVTPAEFQQMLITSVGQDALTVLPDRVVLKTDLGELPITLSPLPPRIIAALELPVTRIEFDYTGWEIQQQQIQQSWLDLHLRRGGG